VAVIAGAAAVTGLGGSPSSSNDGAAANPTYGPSSGRTDDDHAVDQAQAPWAMLSPTGEVTLGDGVQEVRRIDNPLEVSPPQHSVALELRKADAVEWILLAAGPGETWSSSSFEAYVGFGSLEDWVDDQRRLQSGQPAKAYVEFAADGTLQPASDRVELVRQQPNPDLPDNYDGGAETAVAEVVVDDVTYYVLARDPAQPDYIAVPAFIGGRTLADFLDYARAQYAGGAGLR
ncbi:MAG: hypothetical protein M3237_04540, partial [Actinomycetota bacterium]|nr:hypothetical protein [Actinomycetota bacterium]